MTQDEIADRAAPSARYMSAIERASGSAIATVLGREAMALGATPCDLIRPVDVQAGSRSVGRNFIYSELSGLPQGFNAARGDAKI